MHREVAINAMSQRMVNAGVLGGSKLKPYQLELSRLLSTCPDGTQSHSY